MVYPSSRRSNTWSLLLLHPSFNWTRPSLLDLVTTPPPTALTRCFRLLSFVYSTLPCPSPHFTSHVLALLDPVAKVKRKGGNFTGGTATSCYPLSDSSLTRSCGTVGEVERRVESEAEVRESCRAAVRWCGRLTVCVPSPYILRVNCTRLGALGRLRSFAMRQCSVQWRL